MSGFKVGDRVTTHSLNTASMNGLAGVILEDLTATRGRFVVALSLADGGSKQALLKPSNLADGVLRTMEAPWLCDLCNASHAAGTRCTWWQQSVMGECAVCAACVTAGKTPAGFAKEKGCAQQ